MKTNTEQNVETHANTKQPVSNFHHKNRCNIVCVCVCFFGSVNSVDSVVSVFVFVSYFSLVFLSFSVFFSSICFVRAIKIQRNTHKNTLAMDTIGRGQCFFFQSLLLKLKTRKRIRMKNHLRFHHSVLISSFRNVIFCRLFQRSPQPPMHYDIQKRSKYSKRFSIFLIFFHYQKILIRSKWCGIYTHRQSHIDECELKRRKYENKI